MRIFLRKDGDWQLFEGTKDSLKVEFDSRAITLGDRVKLGNDVTLGNYVTLGDDVTLGDRVTLGNYVTLGDGVKLGDRVTLGNYVKLGNDVTLGNYVTLGNHVTLGNDVTLGDRVKLGDRVTSEGLNLRFLSAYVAAAPAHIFIKWLTKERKSPSWGAARSIQYPKMGGIVEEPRAEVGDQQCAVGLRVFRIGVHPADHGLCAPDADLIAVPVEVRSEDICFAGLPGNADKLRVRKLKMLA